MEKYTYKKIWLIAYPILISVLMEQLIGLTDTAFMGRVGEVELGASAIAGVYYLVIFMIALGFSIGAQILMARRNGEGNYQSIGNVFYQGSFFLIGLAAVLFALSQAFSNDVMDLMISSPNVCEKAEDYIQWRVYGFFFSFAALMFRAFFVGTTQTRTLTLNSIVMVISNVVFNYVLVFGKLGLPALGIAGAAIGSSLAELVSLLFFIVYTRTRIDCRRYGLTRIPRVNWRELRHILGISLWMMIQNFLSLATWFIFFVYIEHLGERALAITNVVRSISGFLFMILVAFSSTCSTIVSNLIGEGRQEFVPEIIRRHLRIAFIIILPLAAIAAIFPHAFISIYTDIPDIQQSAVGALRMMCCSYIALIPANIYFQSVSGTGNTRKAFTIELQALVVYMIYITVTILVMRIDVSWAWSSEIVYGAALFVLCYRYIRSNRWLDNRI